MKQHHYKTIPINGANFPAGPELDALIAHNVMGTGAIIMGHPVLVDPSLPPGSFGFAKAASYPPYSTDIAAAWQVWQKLPRPRRIYELEEGGFTIMCGRDYLKFDATPENLIWIKCPTVEHAICLAALAVRAEQDANA